jgi:hypothetical protein
MSDHNMSDDGDDIASDLGELSLGGGLEGLRDCYQALLDEVDAFDEFAKKTNGKIELRHYRNDIKRHLDGLQKASHPLEF